MIQNVIAFFLFALLIGNYIGLNVPDPDTLLTTISERYLATKESLTSNNIEASEPILLIVKGLFMVAAGFALTMMSNLKGVDVSPIIYILISLLFLPIKHIIALLWLLHEKIWSISEWMTYDLFKMKRKVKGSGEMRGEYFPPFS